MFESIELYKTNLIEVDSNMLGESITKLNMHMRNKRFFKPYSFDVHHNEYITEDFTSKNRRQSYYSNCIMENCVFFESGFSGSVFIDCKFIDCNFDFSTFQSCDFRNCEISYTQKKEINGINFAKSIFSNCKLFNIFFQSANFGEARIENTYLEKIKFRSVVFENTLIKDTFLKDIRFASQNFDFLTIENIKTENLVMPFPAMPCIINGLDYLYNTSDNIRFTSCDKGNNRIGKAEYLALIDDFERYYIYTKAFFPLANIMIAQDRLQEAIYATLLGIIQSLKMKNYRMIYQFCKLVQNNPQFTIQHRKKLYDQIKIEIDKEDLSTEDYHLLNMYIREIKELLLNSTCNPYLLLDIKTNIDSSESEKIGIFINAIEKLIESHFEGKEEHSIEIRHNSLENFIVEITGEPEKLITFLASFLACIDYTCKLATFIIKKARKMNKKNEAQNKINSKAIASTSQTFINCNINVVNINYNIFNSYNINPRFQSGYINKSED